VLTDLQSSRRICVAEHMSLTLYSYITLLTTDFIFHTGGTKTGNICGKIVSGDIRGIKNVQLARTI